MGKTEWELSGRRIKEERKRNEWTQEKLADVIHIARQHISQIENGLEGLGSDRATLLADEWNVRVNFLLGYDNFRTFDDLAMNRAAKSNAVFDFFASLGFSFRECFVWNTSVFAAVMGYQIIAPYMTGRGVLDMAAWIPIRDIKENKAPYYEQLFGLSKTIDYTSAVNNKCYIADIWKNPLCSLHGDVGYSIAHAFDTRLGSFELARNPLPNNDFYDHYRELRNMAARCGEINPIIAPYLLDHPHSYCTRPDETLLCGFLHGSSIERCYAFSQNGILEKYIPFSDMERVIKAVKGSSASVLSSMLK